MDKRGKERHTCRACGHARHATASTRSAVLSPPRRSGGGSIDLRVQIAEGAMISGEPAAPPVRCAARPAPSPNARRRRRRPGVSPGFRAHDGDGADPAGGMHGRRAGQRSEASRRRGRFRRVGQGRAIHAALRRIRHPVVNFCDTPGMMVGERRRRRPPWSGMWPACS